MTLPTFTGEGLYQLCQQPRRIRLETGYNLSTARHLSQLYGAWLLLEGLFWPTRGRALWDSLCLQLRAVPAAVPPSSALDQARTSCQARRERGKDPLVSLRSVTGHYLMDRLLERAPIAESLVELLPHLGLSLEEQTQAQEAFERWCQILIKLDCLLQALASGQPERMTSAWLRLLLRRTGNRPPPRDGVSRSRQTHFPLLIRTITGGKRPWSVSFLDAHLKPHLAWSDVLSSLFWHGDLLPYRPSASRPVAPSTLPPSGRPSLEATPAGPARSGDSVSPSDTWLGESYEGSEESATATESLAGAGRQAGAISRADAQESSEHADKNTEENRVYALPVVHFLGAWARLHPGEGTLLTWLEQLEKQLAAACEAVKAGAFLPLGGLEVTDTGILVLSPGEKSKRREQVRILSQVVMAESGPDAQARAALIPTLPDRGPVAASLEVALSQNRENFAARAMPSLKLFGDFWASLRAWAVDHLPPRGDWRAVPLARETAERLTWHTPWRLTTGGEVAEAAGTEDEAAWQGAGRSARPVARREKAQGQWSGAQLFQWTMGALAEDQWEKASDPGRYVPTREALDAWDGLSAASRAAFLTRMAGLATLPAMVKAMQFQEFPLRQLAGVGQEADPAEALDRELANLGMSPLRLLWTGGLIGRLEGWLAEAQATQRGLLAAVRRRERGLRGGGEEGLEEALEADGDAEAVGTLVKILAREGLIAFQPGASVEELAAACVCAARAAVDLSPEAVDELLAELLDGREEVEDYYYSGDDVRRFGGRLFDWPDAEES